MNLALDITAAWNCTNEAGGALASALHALRTDDIDTPVVLRRPARKSTEKDQLGEALFLVCVAEEEAHALLRRTGELKEAIRKQLAAR